ncbi:hypothetical protein ABID23_000345 [Bartonella silvatica]|uniref:Uncharacterized protein n=1 Tax=Bartonella silvatica TaxID=357760 RepID=A0ABV2HFF6_9HYPH
MMFLTALSVLHGVVCACQSCQFLVAVVTNLLF